ncbi:MAG: YjjG family noncanonical pyrimidine nucleotidase [Bacteroidetes bacterium]|nr:YjjG family noncanonical pyrimidine nucleotidase [Bacteroidota bacterium]
MGGDRLTHLFFDLDDTLWDFEKNSCAVLHELFFEFDLSQKLQTDFDTFLAKYKTTNQQLWQKYYRKEIDKSFLRNHRFNEAFKQFNYDNYNENLLVTEQYLTRSPHGTHLKNGCIETLEYLKKQNYQLHIITNGFKEAQRVKIDGSKLRPYFSHIIISEEYNLTKPDEKIFRLAETFANANKHNCVMIGDNFESDIEGAVNAGWEAIHVSSENNAPFQGKTIKNLTELKQLF